MKAVEGRKDGRKDLVVGRTQQTGRQYRRENEKGVLGRKEGRGEGMKEVRAKEKRAGRHAVRKAGRQAGRQAVRKAGRQ